MLFLSLGLTPRCKIKNPSRVTVSSWLPAPDPNQFANNVGLRRSDVIDKSNCAVTASVRGKALSGRDRVKGAISCFRARYCKLFPCYRTLLCNACIVGQV